MPMPESFLTALTELTPHNAWEWFRHEPLKIVVVVLAAVVFRWVLLRSIGRVVQVTMAKADARRSREPGRAGRAGRAIAQAAGIDRERHRQRTLTMASLLRSMVTFFVGLVTILTVMQIIGLPLGPLLASAGVGGVALGFGAQSLVKDFLSGIFMILEDQYGVGDVVDTGEAVGTVENVSLRITQLRDAQGMTWYVRNGEIIRIGNKTQGWSTAMVDIPIAYDQDVEKAIGVIREVVSVMDDDERWRDILLEEPNVVGVESMSAGVITIRVLAKTVANEQFAIQREIREQVKGALDRAGIKSPSPALPPYGGGKPL